MNIGSVTLEGQLAEAILAELQTIREQLTKLANPVIVKEYIGAHPDGLSTGEPIKLGQMVFA